MRVTLTLAVLALIGCKSPPSVPSSIDGAWAAPPSVPGSAFSFNLTQIADSVSGQGQYSIEAGRAGTLTVHGQYAAPVVTLTLTFDYGAQQTFQGRVEDSRMRGTVTDSAGHSSARVFVRQ